MPDGKAPFSIPSRPWLVVAEELSRELNPKRVTELTDELLRALDEQEQNLAVHSQDRHSDFPFKNPS